MSSWRSLRVAPREFSLFSTFNNGQSFCWRQVDPLTWCGVVDQFVYLLRQKHDDVEYRVLNSSTTTHSTTTTTTTATTEEEREETTLRQFLQLETNMEPLKQRWSSGHQKIHADMSMILNSVRHFIYLYFTIIYIVVLILIIYVLTLLRILHDIFNYFFFPFFFLFFLSGTFKIILIIFPYISQ